MSKPRRRREDTRPPRARAARKWLASHGGPVQQIMNRESPGLYLINDVNAEGEEIVYSTRNDEMIVDYYDRIQTGELLEVFLAGGGWIGNDAPPLDASPLTQLSAKMRRVLDGSSRREG